MSYGFETEQSVAIRTQLLPVNTNVFLGCQEGTYSDSLLGTGINSEKGQ